MAATKTVVRHAVAADAPAVGEAHAEAWRVAYADLFDEETLRRAVAARRSRWTAEFYCSLPEMTTVLVAEIDHAVVGFTRFDPGTDPGTYEIGAFYLHPTAWGSGAASHLMRETLCQLAERILRLCVWTLPGAERARRFYAKHGFEETGRRQMLALVDGPPVKIIEYSRIVM